MLLTGYVLRSSADRIGLSPVFIVFVEGIELFVLCFIHPQPHPFFRYLRRACRPIPLAGAIPGKTILHCHNHGTLLHHSIKIQRCLSGAKTTVASLSSYFYIFIGLWVPMILIVPFFSYGFMAQITSYGLLATPALVAVAGAYSWRQGYLPARYYLISWLAFTLGLNNHRAGSARRNFEYSCYGKILPDRFDLAGVVIVSGFADRNQEC